MSEQQRTEYAAPCPYEAGRNSKGQHGYCKLDAGHLCEHQIDWLWERLVDNPYAVTWEDVHQ